MLGIHRQDDVAGWEIPDRFLAFVRGGPADPVGAIVAHNAEDVRSLARLLQHLDAEYADRERRRLAPAGDLFALARGYAREKRLEEALGCLEVAEARWRPPVLGSTNWPFGAPVPVATTVSREQIRSERARTLRRMGRHDDAVATWEEIARGGRVDAVRAWIEVAKLREHLLRDPLGALAATAAAAGTLEWLRSLDAPEPRLEAALAVRRQRLLRRTARTSSRSAAGPGRSRTSPVRPAEAAGWRDRQVAAPRTSPS